MKTIPKNIVANHKPPEVTKHQGPVKLHGRETVATPTTQKPENNQFKNTGDNPSTTSTTIDNTQTVSSKSTACSLLQFAGTWAGDDLEECLQQIYQLRERIAF